MDPVTSLVSGHVAGKLMEYVSLKFKTSVIERWVICRAEKFFDAHLKEGERLPSR